MIVTENIRQRRPSTAGHSGHSLLCCRLSPTDRVSWTSITVNNNLGSNISHRRQGAEAKSFWLKQIKRHEFKMIRLSQFSLLGNTLNHQNWVVNYLLAQCWFGPHVCPSSWMYVCPIGTYKCPMSLDKHLYRVDSLLSNLNFKLFSHVTQNIFEFSLWIIKWLNF